MEEYKFIGNWSTPDTPPSNATRCLVNDGELVIIATYLKIADSDVWMVQGLTNDKEKFDVIGWMPLPRPMEKPPVISALIESSADKSLVGG